jgi:hypothetical protein
VEVLRRHPARVGRSPTCTFPRRMWVTGQSIAVAGGAAPSMRV